MLARVTAVRKSSLRDLNKIKSSEVNVAMCQHNLSLISKQKRGHLTMNHLIKQTIFPLFLHQTATTKWKRGAHSVERLKVFHFRSHELFKTRLNTKLWIPTNNSKGNCLQSESLAKSFGFKFHNWESASHELRQGLCQDFVTLLKSFPEVYFEIFECSFKERRRKRESRVGVHP